jgi:hypothetical protein
MLAILWIASQGSVSNSDLLAPPSVGADTTVTVTAESQADPSKSASASVTVTAQTRVSIAQISIVGQPVMVWDHSQSPEQRFNGPDGPASAWREADGTVNLMINNVEAYRLRGPDLEHLTFDPNKIYSSIQHDLRIPEDDYNFWHFLNGPYSVDGRNFYSLSHSEWYAALLNGDLVFDPVTHTFPVSAPVDNPYPRGVLFNSWTTTVNSFVSADGGASWQLNTVNGNHVVAKTAYHWTGTAALASRAYRHAVLYTGLQQITRMIKEGNYYYAMGNYYHRDWSQINPAAGQYQAPLDKNGIILIRTNDFTNPNGWEAWSGGNTYEAISNQNFKTFLPKRSGAPIDNGPTPNRYPGPAWNPSFVFDTNAQTYILIFVCGTGHVCYMTTPSLANPSWSDYTPILGTATLITNPAGPVRGFRGNNYVSILDGSSRGFNFEFTNGKPLLFYTAGGNIWREQLSISYSH